MNIGNKIIKLRKENNMSQEDLAFKLNVSRQSISKWESNISTPDAYNILELSKLFNVTTDYLLYDDYQSDDDIPKIKQVKQDIKTNKDKELKSTLITIALWIIATIAFIMASIIKGSPLIHLNIILCVVLAIINIFRYINIKNESNSKFQSLTLSLMLIFAIITIVISYGLNRFTYNEILFFTLCSMAIAFIISSIIKNISNHK